MLLREMSDDELQQRWLQQEQDVVAPMVDMTNEKSSLQVFSAVMSNILLFLLIFGLSATVDMKNLCKQLQNKWALITGVAMQFLIMPLLGFLAVLALRGSGLTQAMGLTLLVVTSSPGGSYSNWWCSTFNADLALSVAMTAVSTMLSVGLLPLNLLFYTWLAYGVTGDGEDVLSSVDFKALFLSLGIVIAAIVSGLFTSYKMHSPTFQRWANRGGTVSGIALIVFSAVIGSGTGDAETNFWSQPWPFYIGVALPCILGLFLANMAARFFRLAKPERVAISIECCYQNVGIATSVAITMFDDPTQRAEAVSVPLFYGVVEAVVIGIYCLVSWKKGWTKAPADEKLCVVVSTTYEVSDDETEGLQNIDDLEMEVEGIVLDVSHHQQDSEEEALPSLEEHTSSPSNRWFSWITAPFRPRQRASEKENATKEELTKNEDGLSPDRSRLQSEDTVATSGTASSFGTTNNTSGMDISLESLPEGATEVMPTASSLNAEEATDDER